MGCMQPKKFAEDQWSSTLMLVLTFSRLMLVSTLAATARAFAPAAGRRLVGRRHLHSSSARMAINSISVEELGQLLGGDEVPGAESLLTLDSVQLVDVRAFVAVRRVAVELGIGLGSGRNSAQTNCPADGTLV